MPTTVDFQPFRTTDRIQLSILDMFDPRDENHKFAWKEEGSEDEALTFRLVDEDWSSLVMEVSATVPQADLDRILPKGSDVGANTKLLLSVRCFATRVRESVSLQFVGSGSWRGRIALERDQLARNVEIKPLLVRSTWTETDMPRIAQEFAGTIGTGTSIRIQIDPFDVIPGTGLNVSWEDFRASKNSWRKTHDSDLYHLDFAGAAPVLVLNLRYTSFRAALHSTKSRGIEATIRHLGNAMLAHATWTQLLFAAIGAIELDPESGEPSPPPTAWKAEVLKKFLPRIYPDTNSIEQLQRAAESLRDPASSQVLASLLGSAVQEQVKTFRLVEQAGRASEGGE